MVQVQKCFGRTGSKYLNLRIDVSDALRERGELLNAVRVRRSEVKQLLLVAQSNRQRLNNAKKKDN
jgi:hypothetical protein